MKVSPCGSKTCTVRVGPHKSVFLYSDVSKVRFKYEVCLIQQLDRQLITNVYGVTNAPFTPQEGGTVLQRNLVHYEWVNHNTRKTIEAKAARKSRIMKLENELNTSRRECVTFPDKLIQVKLSYSTISMFLRINFSGS